MFRLPIIQQVLMAGSFLFSLGAAGQSWQSEQDGAVRWKELKVPTGSPGFTLVNSEAAGLNFKNLLDELSSARNRTLENGAGVAVGDFDSDGRPDIFFCSLEGNNSLFKNHGDWQFENVTATALPPVKFPARGAVFADINGDSSRDLLIATLSEGVRCYTNAGAGKLVENKSSGTRTNLGVTTLALADIDRNGTLDLYAATYRTDDIRDRARIDIQRVGGKVVVAPALQDRIVLTASGLFEYGEPDILYLNDGQGHFTPGNNRFLFDHDTASPQVHKDWGLAASFRDLNADGWPDLYTCNDYWTPDRAWLNTAAGQFIPLSPEALPHASENSMGVDFADINADGHLDFFVTDMRSRDHRRRHSQSVARANLPLELAHLISRPHYMQNMLFLNRGDGTFSEIAEFSGVPASEWSWQPVFMDIDLDGFLDLLIPAGHSRDVQDIDATEEIRRLQHSWPNMPADELQSAFTRELLEHARLYPRYDAPIVTFRNNGDLTFTVMTTAWGTDHTAIHQGLACADLDADGDLDFVVNNLNASAGLYRNNAPSARIIIRLYGSPPNTDAIGARIMLAAENLPLQTTEVVSGGRYLSGSDTECVFAASNGENTVQIRFPDGAEVRFEAQGNRRYEVRHPEGNIFSD